VVTVTGTRLPTIYIYILVILVILVMGCYGYQWVPGFLIHNWTELRGAGLFHSQLYVTSARSWARLEAVPQLLQHPFGGGPSESGGEHIDKARYYIILYIYYTHYVYVYTLSIYIYIYTLYIYYIYIYIYTHMYV